MNYFKILLCALLTLPSASFAMEKKPTQMAAESSVQPAKRIRLETSSTKVVTISLPTAIECPLNHLFPVEVQFKIFKHAIEQAAGETPQLQLKNAANNLRPLITANKASYNNISLHGFIIMELAKHTNNIIEAAVALHTKAGGQWLKEYYIQHKDKHLKPRKPEFNPDFFPPFMNELEQQVIDALYNAIQNNHVNTVSFLMQYVPNILTIDQEIYDYEPTPLMCAAELGHIEIARLLLTSETGVTEDDISEALAWALDNELMVRLLLTTNISNTKKTWPLVRAAERGAHAIVKILIDSGVDVNLYHDTQTALLSAISNEDGRPQEPNAEKTVQLLLNAKANPNLEGKEDGFTPLMGAAGNGWLEIVKLLLQAEADVHMADHDKRTALMLACRGGHKEVVKELLNAGAGNSINLKDKTGLTAVMYAAKKGHSEIVQLLLAIPGINPDLDYYEAEANALDLLLQQFNQWGELP